jgi:hypothetical protein
MPLKTAPTSDFRTAPWAAWKTGLNDIRDIAASLPGGGSTPVTKVIASGQITVDGGDILLDTEGAASTDVLTNINLVGLPQNRVFRLRITNNARQVTIQHMFSNGSGNGEIILASGDEPGDTLVLDNTMRSIELERRGNQIVEVGRGGFTAGAGGWNGKLEVDLDGNFKRASSILWSEKDINLVDAPGNAYTVKREDVGDWLNVNVDCTVTLPNPNAPDPNGFAWLSGMVVTMQRHASLLRARTHTGSTPNHPLGHDRALGSVPGAVIQVKVCKFPNGLLFWRLMGETTGAGVPGGGEEPPPPTTIERTYLYSPPIADTVTANTTLTPAGTFTHAPPANSKFLYLLDVTLSTTGINSTNNSALQVVNTAVPGTAIAHLGRGRQANLRPRTVLGWAAAYGASPASQTFRAEIYNSVDGFSVECRQPQFVAIKLETDEEFGVQSGAVAPAAGAYAAAASVSYTAAADDYIVLGGFSIEMTSDQRYRGKMTVGGVDVVPQTEFSRANPSRGYYFTMKKITHAGGTLSASIQAGNVAGTANVIHGWIAVLRSDRFQSFDYAESPAETATMSSVTPLVKVSKTPTLQSNWRTLMLATCQGYVDTDTLGDGCSINMHRNGAQMGQEHESGIRLQSGQPAHYAPHSFGLAQLITPTSSDVFDLRYYSEDGASSNVKVRDATMAFLALGPVA